VALEHLEGFQKHLAMFPGKGPPESGAGLSKATHWLRRGQEIVVATDTLMAKEQVCKSSCK